MVLRLAKDTGGDDTFMPMESETTALEHGPLRDDDELRAYLTIAMQALPGLPLPSEPEWVETWKARQLPHGRIRITRRNGALAAGLLDLDLAQWFGGRSVPMAGVSFVACAPEHRDRGVARAMMRDYVRTLHARGVPISGLYPASQPLYRAAGYELAGHYQRHLIAIPSLRLRVGELNARRATPADHGAMRALYDARARRCAGMLDRGEWLWARILDPPRGGPAHAYVLEAPETGALEGHLVFTLGPIPGHPLGHELNVSDMQACTARGHRAVLALLASHRSIVPRARVQVAPNDPFLAILDDQQTTGMEWRIDAMLRIVDVGKAMVARGWPRSARAELHFEVEDDLLEDNRGRWIVEVGGGEASVRRGGDGAIRLDVRALATLYSGYLSPFDLRRLGKLACADDGALESAAEVFAGTPCLLDMF